MANSKRLPEYKRIHRVLFTACLVWMVGEFILITWKFCGWTPIVAVPAGMYWPYLFMLVAMTDRGVTTLNTTGQARNLQEQVLDRVKSNQLNDVDRRVLRNLDENDIKAIKNLLGK